MGSKPSIQTNNEEEAEKEMAKAEECYRRNNILGAHKHITKAHSLNPTHPHTAKVMEAIRVLVVALDMPIKPSTDYWCKILGCNPTDDLQTMKLQYKRMCLLIHPDKNPSICANEAFKFVYGAWVVLSESQSQNHSKDNTGSDNFRNTNFGASKQHNQSTSSSNNNDHDQYNNKTSYNDFESSDSSTKSNTKPESASSSKNAGENPDDHSRSCAGDHNTYSSKYYYKEHSSENYKEEAEKETAKAEDCYKSNNILGANKHIRKAHSLNPSHQHIAKVMAAIQVHVVALEKPFRPSTDYWCKILGCNPTDDLQTMKLQYKKMCLLIHPDKNPSICADEAFKLVSDAWEALSASQSQNHSKDNTGSDNFRNNNFGASKQHNQSTSSRNNNDHDQYNNKTSYNDFESSDSSTKSNTKSESASSSKNAGENPDDHSRSCAGDHNTHSSKYYYKEHSSENYEEEAEKEMAKAEDCYKSNNILSANKHIRKAHSLNPSHQHIAKVMAAIQVHVVALEKPFRPSTDYWCKILGCNPTDDLQTMKLQYKKMCLLIHPDKNPSICADEAFKLVSDAWEALSTSQSQNHSKDNTGSDNFRNTNFGASKQHSQSTSSSNNNDHGQYNNNTSYNDFESSDSSTKSNTKPESASSSKNAGENPDDHSRSCAGDHNTYSSKYYYKEHSSENYEEEAEKEMAKAEDCYKSNNILGANKHITKAHSLNPSHQHIAKVMAAIRVHVVALDKPFRPSTDYWCKILGCNPTDDLQTMKLQYKKMCLIVHPDKNPSICADEAFKLVSDAWEALSASQSQNHSKDNTGSDNFRNTNFGASKQHSQSTSSSNNDHDQYYKKTSHNDFESTESSTNSGTKSESASSSKNTDENSGDHSQSCAGDHNTNSSKYDYKAHSTKNNFSSAQKPSFFHDSTDNDEKYMFASKFKGKFDTENIQVTSLVQMVLSWSLKDVFNRNFFKDEVKTIPKTFTSLEQYLNSFTNPLIEETHADLCSNLEIISQAPYGEVEYIEELSAEQLQYYIKVRSQDKHLDGKETYTPLEADMLLLSECKIKHISDLMKNERSYVIAYVLKAGNETGVLSSNEHIIKTTERFPIEKYFKKLGKEPQQMKPLYAVHILTMITFNRIWKSLNQHMDGQRSNDILNKVWNYNVLEAEVGTLISAYYDDDLESFKLNKSQFDAVKDCLSTIYDQNQKSTMIKLIWGPPGTGKTKTISTLLYVLLQKNSKTLACAPTNTAIKEVTTRLLKLVKESPSQEHFRLGDLALFGNKKRLKIDNDLSEVFIEDRVERLRAVFVPLTGWRHQLSSMLDLFENATSQYELYLRTVKENEEGSVKLQELTLKEYIVKHFFSHAKELRVCLITMSTDLPRISLSDKNLENMTMLIELVDSFGKYLKSVRVTSNVLAEIFEESILGMLKDQLLRTNDYTDIKNKLRSMRSHIVKILRVLSRTILLPDLCNRSSIQEFCLQNAVVIICTTSTSFKLHNVQMEKPIENLVVDEAAQLKECESLIPLQLPGIRHAIFIGDEHQLPALVKSKISENAGFGRSLFERLSYLGHKRHLLDVQYRMHPSISKFPNANFYDKRISDGANVLQRSYEQQYLTGQMYGPYSFISIEAGKETSGKNGRGWKNMIEVEVVFAIIKSLYKAFSTKKEKIGIGVISPYTAQVSAIQEEVKKTYSIMDNVSVKVQTIDGFQGGEEDIIIISTVRSNKAGNVGFLDQLQRTNVSLTRAKHCLWIVGSGSTLLKSNSIWRKIVRDAMNRGCFFDAKDDHSLDAVIVKAAIENDELDNILKMDTLSIQRKNWKACNRYNTPEGCKFGDRCNFSHGETSWSILDGTATNDRSLDMKTTTSNSNLKTKICRNFAKGSCKYGTKCSFAHGSVELRKSFF